MSMPRLGTPPQLYMGMIIGDSWCMQSSTASLKGSLVAEVTSFYAVIHATQGITEQ